jgi:hypothetical protein
MKFSIISCHWTWPRRYTSWFRSSSYSKMTDVRNSEVDAKLAPVNGGSMKHTIETLSLKWALLYNFHHTFVLTCRWLVFLRLSWITQIWVWIRSPAVLVCVLVSLSFQLTYVNVIKISNRHFLHKLIYGYIINAVVNSTLYNPDMKSDLLNT